MLNQAVKLLLAAGTLVLTGCVMPSDYGYVRPDGGYANAPGGYYAGEGYGGGYDNGYYAYDGYDGGYYDNCAGGCGSVSIGVGYGYGYGYGYPGYGYGYPYYGGYYDYHHHRHEDGDRDGDDHGGHGHWGHGHGSLNSGGFDEGAHAGRGNGLWRSPDPATAPHGGERPYQPTNGNGFPQARFDQPWMPERSAAPSPVFARPKPVMRAEHAAPAPSRQRDARIDQQ